MLQDLKQNLIGRVGISYGVAAIGVASSIVTVLVVDVNSTVSVRWIIAVLVIAAWIILGLATTIVDLIRERSRLPAIDLNRRLDEIKELISLETISITATCFAFERVNENKVRIYLVSNPNFSNWWLAPGGHADLKENAWPDKVAVEKCLVEANLKVTILPGAPTDAGHFKSCGTRDAPHFCYLLEIPPTSRCAQMKHHNTHYDFTYVADVQSHIPDVQSAHDKSSALHRKAVELEMGVTAMEMDSVLSSQLRDIDSSGKIDRARLYPDDFPARIYAALLVYRQLSTHHHAKENI